MNVCYSVVCSLGNELDYRLATTYYVNGFLHILGIKWHKLLVGIFKYIFFTLLND